MVYTHNDYVIHTKICHTDTNIKGKIVSRKIYISLKINISHAHTFDNFYAIKIHFISFFMRIIRTLKLRSNWFWLDQFALQHLLFKSTWKSLIIDLNTKWSHLYLCAISHLSYFPDLRLLKNRKGTKHSVTHCTIISLTTEEVG